MYVCMYNSTYISAAKMKVHETHTFPFNHKQMQHISVVERQTSAIFFSQRLTSVLHNRLVWKLIEECPEPEVIFGLELILGPLPMDSLRG